MRVSNVYKCDHPVTVYLYLGQATYVADELKTQRAKT